MTELETMKNRLKANPKNKEALALIQAIIDRKSGFDRPKTASSKLGYLNKRDEREIIRNVQMYYSLNTERSFLMKHFFEKWKRKLGLIKSK